MGRYEKFYWVLLVLVRKASIAGVALFLRTNAALQMSLLLVVMFIAFTVHAIGQPYVGLGRANKSAMLADYTDGLDAQSSREVKIHALLEKSTVMDSRKQALADAASLSRANEKAQAGGAGSGLDNAPQVLVNLLTNLNTVESILLFVMTCVCLSGIMFASGQLDSPHYADQKLAVTWIIIVLVVFTCIYIGTIGFTAVYGPDKTLQMCARKKRAKVQGALSDSTKAAADALSGKKGPKAELSLQVNPLHLNKAHQAELKEALETVPPEWPNSDPTPLHWEQLKQKLAAAEKQRDALQTAIDKQLAKESAKKAVAAGSGSSAAAAARSARNRGRGRGWAGTKRGGGKRAFGQASARASVAIQR